MYFSHLDHPQPPLPAALETAIAWLRETDVSQMAPGRYPIDGDAMFALVQTVQTGPWEDGRPEFHERYIDVQCLLEGEELMGYSAAEPALAITQNLLAERDIAFTATPTSESRLVMRPGHFVVFFPGELHRPNCVVSESMQTRKVVVKIARERVLPISPKSV